MNADQYSISLDDLPVDKLKMIVDCGDGTSSDLPPEVQRQLTPELRHRAFAKLFELGVLGFRPDLDCECA